VTPIGPSPSGGPGRVRVVDLKPEAELRDEVRRYFPHREVRKYQADLSNRLYEVLHHDDAVAVEAPTGLGKTAAVGAAVRAYAEKTKTKILWLTRTAAQCRHVAAELPGFLPFYGRRLLCLHEAVSKIEQRRFNAACRATRLAGRCPYWPGRPRALRAVAVKELREAGLRTATCPYEHQLAALPASPCVAATHRQLGLIGWLLARWRVGKDGVLLVLDEAQHIVNQALSMVRDSISLTTLERAAREARRWGFEPLAAELERAVRGYAEASASTDEAEVEDLLPDLHELMEVGQEVQERKLKSGFVPSSYLLSVADFKAALGGGRPLLVREGRKAQLIALGDPVEELKRVLEGWRKVVLMSATVDVVLIEALLRREITLLRAGWPFEPDALRAIPVRGLTTKFERRDETLYKDVSWLISVLPRGSLAFLPSHEMVARVRAEGVLKEERGMSQEEIERLLQGQNAEKLIAVLGGRLSEGIDLRAPVVALVGIPFAPPTPRTKMLVEKLKSLMGDERRAHVHGVILPAVFSAVQAAGRAVRGPGDRALVLMVDDRYKPLTRFLPR